MAKSDDMVTVEVDIELRGTIRQRMTRAAADKLQDEFEGWRDADVDNLPFEVSWDELVNSGEASVEDIYTVSEK